SLLRRAAQDDVFYFCRIDIGPLDGVTHGVARDCRSLRIVESPTKGLTDRSPGDGYNYSFAQGKLPSFCLRVSPARGSQHRPLGLALEEIRWSFPEPSTPSSGACRRTRVPVCPVAPLRGSTSSP